MEEYYMFCFGAKTSYFKSRIIASFLFGLMLMAIFTMFVTNIDVEAANKNGTKIYVNVNGQKITKKKTAGRKIGKKYLANVKLMAKVSGIKITNKKKTVNLSIAGSKKVRFTLAKKAYYKGKKCYKADIAPRKIGGKIFVSVKAFAKAFGYTVFGYDSKSKTFSIGVPQDDDAPTSTPKAPETNDKSEVTLIPTTPIPSSIPNIDATPANNVLPTDKYPVILYKNMDGGTFFSSTQGSTTKAEGGANGSAAGVKMIAGSTGTYDVTPTLISGSTYYATFYVKGKLNGIYCTPKSSTPTLDLSDKTFDDWTYVQAEFVAGRDVTDKLSVKVVGDMEQDGFIDEFKLIRYVPAGQGSDENYENPLMRIRINATNFYRIEDYSIKNEKLDATITIDDGTSEHNVVVPTSEIVLEGRGNSTFYGVPKKPLKFKFKNGAQPIGNLPKGKKWNLMAEYYDRTLMRNGIIQNFAGSLTGLGYATRTEFVEVYVNEVYKGVYLLTEAITVSENRVNIDNDPTKENFGFIVEWDDRAIDEAQSRYDEVRDNPNISSPEDTYFTVQIDGKMKTFAYKSPDAEDMTPVQREYIRNTVQQASDSIAKCGQNDEYLNYCDLDSFVDYFIVNDFAQNSDAISFASIYLHKDKDGKLKMGPVWDYDIYVGNGGNKPTNKCLEWGSPWFSPLVTQNNLFKNKLSQRWDEIKNTVVKDELINYVAELETKLTSAAARNFAIWNTQNDASVFVGTLNRTLAGSWKGEVDYLQTWLNARWTYADGYY